jgi:DNA helicase II / ATP-dependent DNA helicase PcrA
MTRAKDDLHLICPYRFFTHQQPSFGDRHVYASRTRFIPAAILDRFDVTSWPRASAPKPAVGAAPSHGLDLQARMRAAWR